MKIFDNYEISPCTRTEQPDKPGHYYFEVCEPKEADVWTLYGHLKGEGVQAIGDFPTREDAAEVYSRITGLAFTGSYEALSRLRVMHAGPTLFEALHWLVDDLTDAGEDRNPESGHEFDSVTNARAALLEATTGDSQPELRRPIIIEVLGGVVQDVQNVPHGYTCEVRDYDDLEAAAGQR